jgi:serine/threonine protein kinase
MPAPGKAQAPTLEAPPTRSPSRPGDVLGKRYELLEAIGAGGMGEVWRARHTLLDKKVALKLLTGSLEKKDRFLKEAKLLASIRHPNVVEVHDVGETEDGTPFFVMELLEGATLADVVYQTGTIDAEDAVDLILKLLRGLCAVHAAGIVHRDIKPDNILLVADGTKATPKLLDFGVAHMAGTTRLTRAGMLVGTPEYMAPELIRGQEPDARADVWGVALTLYEALTAVSPFHKEDVIPAFRSVVDDPLPFPTHIAGFDSKLWRILLKALSKAPEARHATAEELAKALQEWLDNRRERSRPAPAAPPRASDREPIPPTLEAARAPTVPPSGPTPLDALIRKKLDAG